jgi:hypothetical protein
MESVNISSKDLDLTSFFGDFEIYIPCYGSIVDGKSVKATNLPNWNVKALYYAEAISKKPSMVAVRLDDYIVLDCDGNEIVQKLLESDLGIEYENTLYIGRNKNRGSFFFKKPDTYNLKPFKVPLADGLIEIRTGQGFYQVVQGTHPETKQDYVTNALPVNDLPDSVLAMLVKLAPISRQEEPYTHMQLAPAQTLDYLPPLTEFISAKNYDYLTEGVDTTVESRNCAGFALASDLLGVEMLLKEQNIEFSGDARTLFKEYCQRCRPPIDDKELETIWKSAKKEAKKPAISPDIFKKRVENWECLNNLLKPIDPVEAQVSVNKTVATFAAIVRKLDEIIMSVNYLDTQYEHLELLCETIYHEYKITLFQHQKYIREQVFSRWKDTQRMISNDQNTLVKDLPYVSGFRVPSFEKTEFYNAFKTEMLLNNFPFEHLFINFLTSFSALVPANFRFQYHKGSSISPNVFTLLIGDVASGKSRLMSPFMTPFLKLSREQNNTAVDEQKNWQKAYEAFKKMSKEEKIIYFQNLGSYVDSFENPEQKFLELNPEPVKIVPYSVSDVTLEALRDICGDVNERTHGILWATDEYSKLLGTVKRFSSDGSDPSAEMLPVFNCDPTNHNRVGQTQKKFGFYRVSLLASTQIDRVSKFFDLNDSSGILSRFWLTVLDRDISSPVLFSKRDDVPESNLKNLVVQAINKYLSKFAITEEEVLVEFKDSEAFECFAEFHETVVGITAFLRNAGNKTGYTSWLRRLPEHLARIVFVWHLIRYAEGLEPELKQVSQETVQECIPIALWLKGQFEFVTGKLVDNKVGDLDPQLQECINAVKIFIRNKNGKVTRRLIINGSLPRKQCLLDRYKHKTAYARKILTAQEVDQMLAEMLKLNIITYVDSQSAFILTNDSALAQDESAHKAITRTRKLNESRKSD